MAGPLEAAARLLMHQAVSGGGGRRQYGLQSAHRPDGLLRLRLSAGSSPCPGILLLQGCPTPTCFLGAEYHAIK